jgi:hypothetical protein
MIVAHTILILGLNTVVDSRISARDNKYSPIRFHGQNGENDGMDSRLKYARGHTANAANS